MKERGINNTFKKIIFESSEMVFLADDSYPYNIFYSNQAFENQIGQFLDERSLVGLGLDINSYIFNEELILPFMGVEYTFFLELPQENASNYFLFYKGKEMRGQGLPTKADSQYFFRNSIDLIGIGQESFLTWVSHSVKPLLGYNPEDIVNIELYSYFHPDDYDEVKSHLFDVRQERKNSHFVSRLLTKSGEYRWFEFNVHFIVGKFYAVARDITDTKNQIGDFENKIELLQLSQSMAQVGFWELNKEENTVSLSDQSLSIFGLKNNTDLSLEETINLFSPENRSLAKSSISALLASGKEINLSLQIKAKEDQVKWVKFSGRAVILSNDESKIFGTVQDITEEYTKLNQMGVFGEIFNLAPDAIVISDLTGKVLFYNQLAKTTFDDSESSAFPEKISELEPVFSDKEIWANHIDQLSANGSKIYQSSFKNAKGLEIPVEVAVRLSQIQDSQYLISNIRQVQRSQISTGISSGSKDFLQHLTEQIPGALYQFVVEKEGDMKFAYLSPGIKQLLDLNENELADFKDVGKAISKVYPEDIANVLTTTVTSARKLSTWSCKFRIFEPGTKSYKWVLGAAKPELMENGDVVWYGYLTDITDQKVFEDKLRNAKEEALKASQIKSEFLSIISHELRTPLNAI